MNITLRWMHGGKPEQAWITCDLIGHRIDKSRLNLRKINLTEETVFIGDKHRPDFAGLILEIGPSAHGIFLTRQPSWSGIIAIFTPEPAILIHTFRAIKFRELSLMTMLEHGSQKGDFGVIAALFDFLE